MESATEGGVAWEQEAGWEEAGEEQGSPAWPPQLLFPRRPAGGRGGQSAASGGESGGAVSSQAAVCKGERLSDGRRAA